VSTTFQRKIENFSCENCGFFVEGNGYTNHCPKCLWSKHVDNNPGDREARCMGLMEPIGIEKKGKNYEIIHQCVKCKKTLRNITKKDDDFESVIKISQKTANRI
jgi:hypothetical protein